MCDHYIGAEILLSRGDKIARGHVVACSHNAGGNVMGKAYTTPIFDPRMYHVEFAESILQ